MAARPDRGGAPLEALVALLRGVNVGGHNKIQMEELRALCTDLRLRDVSTYIQSGNVVFNGPEGASAETATRISRAIQTRWGYELSVIVRSLAELRQIVGQNPFAGNEGIAPAKVLVLFLESEPLDEGVRKALAIPAGDDQMHLFDRHAYIYYPNGMGRPKLQVSALERALKVRGTGRNWNTIAKLIEMAAAIEA